MAEYEPFDPHVQVIGQVLQAWVEGTHARIVPVLARHGISYPQENAWYAQTTALNVLREFARTEDLVAMGKQIINFAIFPPGLATVEEALHAINEAYHMNHRGGEIGYYHTRMQAPRHIVVTCKNPYPCDFDYGIILGMAQRFLPRSNTLTVKHDKAAGCRKEGENICVYHVTW